MQFMPEINRVIAILHDFPFVSRRHQIDQAFAEIVLILRGVRRLQMRIVQVKTQMLVTKIHNETA